MKKLLTALLLVALASVVFLGSVVVKQHARIQALERQLGAPPVVATVHAGETRAQFIARNEAKKREIDRTVLDMVYSMERTNGADPQTAYNRAVESINRPLGQPKR